MGFFIAFGLVYLGYGLIDWGHYQTKHEDVSLWYLLSGFGPRISGTSTSDQIAQADHRDQLPLGSIATAGGNSIQGNASTILKKLKGLKP